MVRIYNATDYSSRFIHFHITNALRRMFPENVLTRLVIELLGEVEDVYCGQLQLDLATDTMAQVGL